MCTCVSLGAPHYAGTHRGQKRTSDTLEMDLEAVVSHHVGAGNGTKALWWGGGGGVRS